MKIDEYRAQLMELRAQVVTDYEADLARIDRAIEALQPENLPAPVSQPPTKRQRKRMPAAARAAVSARMKKYWADRRKKKG